MGTTTTSSEEGLAHDKFDAIKSKFNNPSNRDDMTAADVKNEKLNATVSGSINDHKSEVSVASSAKDLNDLNRPISFAGVTTVSGVNDDQKSNESSSVVNSAKDLNDLNRPLSFAGETTVAANNDTDRKSKTFIGDRGNIDTWAKNPAISPEHSQHPQLSPTTAGMVASLDGMMGTSSEENKPEEMSNKRQGNVSSLDSMMGTNGSAFTTGMTTGQPQQSQSTMNSSAVTGNIGNSSLTTGNVAVLPDKTAGTEEHHSHVADLKQNFNHHGSSSTSSGTSIGTSPGTSSGTSVGTSAVDSKKATLGEQKNISSSVAPVAATTVEQQPKVIDTAVNSEEGLTHDKFDAIKYKFNHPSAFHKEVTSTDLKKENFNAIKDKFSHGNSHPVPAGPGKPPLHPATHQFDENAENKKPVNSI